MDRGLGGTILTVWVTAIVLTVSAFAQPEVHMLPTVHVHNESRLGQVAVITTSSTDSSIATVLTNLMLAERTSMPLGTMRSDSTVWFAWRATAAQDFTGVLEFEMAYVPRIDVYELQNGEANRRSTGMAVGRNERDLRTSTHAVECSILAGDTVTYVVRLWGAIGKVVSEAPVFRSRSAFEDGARMVLYRNGLFFGLIVALVLYNLFVYISTKERTYLAYVLNSAITGVWMYAFESLPTITMPNSVGESNLVILYCGSSTAAVLGTWFVTELLRTKEMAPRLHKAMVGFMVVAGMYALTIPFMLRAPWSDFVNLLGFIQAGLCIAAGVIGVRSGKREALVYVAAYSVLLIALFYWTGSNLVSIIPRGLDGFTALKIGTAVELLVLSMLLADRLNTMRKAREEADRKTLEAELYRLRTVELEDANRRSNSLLLNILPEAIAERMKAGEQRIADSYDNVCVLFADIAGFTTWSSALSASQTVEYLDTIFSAMDALAEKHGMEKIKTIGDCYMVVAGLPHPVQDAAARAARFSLELRELPNQLPPIPGTVSERLALRIGMDVGPVVAGVIGKSKFSFDLWGNVVNMASRMESHGAANCIRCTNNVEQILRDQFEFSKPEDITVKGKGALRTFFLQGHLNPTHY